MVCKKNKYPCSGDMRHIISIYRSELSPNNLNNGRAEIDEILIGNVPCKITTVSSSAMVDGFNYNNQTTHKIWFRYEFLPILDNGYIIQYNNEWWKILDSQNMNEENRFWELRCNKLGRVEYAKSDW